MVKRLLGFAAILTAISCGNSPSPTSPTPTPPPAAVTITALTVTAGTPSASGVQLVAMITLSDQTSKDVTAVSAWTSSNASLAAVSAGGLVTVVTSGAVDVSATYQSVRGSLHLDVVQAGWAISGRVSPVSPNTPPFLSGVRVEIVSGADTGAFAVTDANGAFRLANLKSGVIDVQVTAVGYSVWTLTGLHLAGDQEFDPTLYPTPPRDATGASATAQCKDGTWSWTSTFVGACAANGGVAWGVCPGPICEA